MSRPPAVRWTALALIAAAALASPAGCKKAEKGPRGKVWIANVVPVSQADRDRADKAVKALWADPAVQAAAASAKAEEANFRRDLTVLTRHPHRLCGWGQRQTVRAGEAELTVAKDLPGSLAAGQYVADRLKAMGVEVVINQDFSVIDSIATECSLTVDGNTYTAADGVHTMRPNHLQGPATPKEGLVGRTVYAGKGELKEYTADPRNAIVVLEFAAGDRWTDAFALGAQAVIFLGGEAPVAYPWHHVNHPANLPRFHVAAELAEKLKLRSESRTVTLRSASRWASLIGSNVIGIIRGTDPVFDKKKKPEEQQKEAMLLSAPLDSLSEVPELSRGARGAANCAALLALAEQFQGSPPRRDILLCFLDGETLNHAGARALYGHLYRDKAKPRKELEERLEMFLGEKNDKGEEVERGEKDHMLDIRKVLDAGDIFSDKIKGNSNEYPGYEAARDWMRREAKELGGEYARDELQQLRLIVRRHSLAARDGWEKARELRADLDRIASASPQAGGDGPAPAAGDPAKVRPDEGALRSELRGVAEQACRHWLATVEANEKVFPLKVEDAAWSHLERALHRREYPSVARLSQPKEKARLQGLLEQLNQKIEKFKAEDIEGPKGANTGIAWMNRNVEGFSATAVAFNADDHKVSVEKLIERVPSTYDICLERVKAQTAERLEEIERWIDFTKTGMVLSKAMGPDRNTIILHVAMNLGDASGRWTLIHGQDSQGVHATKDDMGKYATMFHVIADMAKSGGEDTGLETRALEDPFANRTFAPGRVAHPGGVAGTFGIQNLAVMTPMDRYPRDGQPCDVVARGGAAGLDVEQMLAAMKRFAPFCRRVFSDEKMSLKKPINPAVQFTEVDFYLAGGKAKYRGPSVLIMTSGSVLADVPARGAIVAVMKKGGKLWEGHPTPKFPPGFRPFSLARVEVNGRFELPPYSADWMGAMVVVSALYDDRGLINRITNTQTINQAQPLTNHAGNMFPCHSATMVGLGFDRLSFNTQALKASSTAPLNEDRSLVVEGGNILTVYVKDDTDKVKLFNPEGMIVLGNAPPADPVVGEGVRVEPFVHYPSVDVTAANGLNLNQGRLTILRDNRILENSIERLHLEAQNLHEKAQKMDGGDVAGKLGTEAAAAAYNRRAYGPLHGVLNDLVVAVVLLLLLSIPFAYSIERLLIGSPHIYRQIGWFVVFFLITFGVLYMVNPAFRIAATPIVIFLAFGIILLSVAVMVIMTRKLETEVRRLQGLGTTVHSSDVSRLSTMMAAVHMGISTMRRRPIRTLLTAATVVLLTFTILTFASFGSGWGNRQTFSGPLSGPPRVMVRHPLWTRIDREIPDTLEGFLADRAEVVPRYWVAQTASEVEAYATANQIKKIPVSNADGKRIVNISVMVGIDPRDVQRLPELAKLLGGKGDALAGNGVFLTHAVAGENGLGIEEEKEGETIYVDGVRCTLAGRLNTREVTNYTQLEGSSLLPVDYEASSGKSTGTYKAAETTRLEDLPEVQSAQFVTFGASRVAVCGDELARRLGGRVCSLNIFPRERGREEADRPVDIERVGQEVATVTKLPTYLGARGEVNRLFFTSLTAASGWRDLIIPVVLGGLIIFATMLGSVSDREKEIYAFSALGLAPPHVAGLFFAEACVYAVVGGMGGYLLGQVVSRSLSYIASAGWFGSFSPPTMNYSSTNATVTVLAVMCTVLVSTIYPAIKASRSANPGIQRSWKIGKPDGDVHDIVFPFTVSAYDITGVVSFLREHFQNFSDTALGVFATASVHVFKQSDDKLGMQAQVALAPFDLGVSEAFALMAQPSEIEGIEEIRILLRRLSGTRGDWQRANRVFINELRKQLLIWRSLQPEIMERYRQMTLTQWTQLPVEDVTPETFGETR